MLAISLFQFSLSPDQKQSFRTAFSEAPYPRALPLDLRASQELKLLPSVSYQTLTLDPQAEPSTCSVLPTILFSVY